ncbi:AraC family transcriptional regulator [Granulicella rosea]|uniref:AraC family transcriptional regulator n=1 Tax=Granulicella rosea TaxID=474952 RepID=A0A239DQW7_9BACT|nr:AraC family transcriptional regulator [Granulicella rosea]SNS34900.1 AraC family transcriptional regulator [Granulicella rosea]
MVKPVPAGSPTRISVLRDNRVVPLIPTARAGKATPQPWRHIKLERHAVGAIEIPEHVHGEFCLHLQLSGADDFEWWSEGRNRVERTAPGAMILLAPGTRDRLHWQGASERLILSFEPELLGDAAPSFRNRWSLDDPALAHLLRGMEAERASNWPLGALYADLLGLGLARHMLQRHASTPRRFELQGKLPMPKLRRTLEFMTDNLNRDLRLEDVAAEAGLSPFHFAREFRATTGQTPYQYLLDQRIDRAKHLLRATDWQVGEIGQQVGFASPVNFVRAFRQRVGATPGAWRSGSF